MDPEPENEEYQEITRYFKNPHKTDMGPHPRKIGGNEAADQAAKDVLNDR
jgi:hypothetical protein